MIIIHKEPNYLGFGFNPEMNRPKVMLIPGANEVSKEDWDAVKHTPALQNRIAAGTLEIVGGEESEKDISIENAIDGLKEPAAIKLVKECMVEDALVAWEKKAKSAKVKKAIKEQLEELRKPVEYREIK